MSDPADLDPFPPARRRSFRTSEAVIPAGTLVTTRPAAIMVNRNEFSGYSRDRFLQNQTSVTARVATGEATQNIVADSYAGGELRIRAAGGDHLIKSAAGDLVLYPARSIH